MKRLVLWVVAGLLVVLLTLLFFLPASWLTPVIEQQTAGRISLGDPEGSVWRGSAFIGVASDANTALVPLVPGRFSWQLSPLLLVGRVDAQLHNSAALQQPLFIRGSWRQWSLSPSGVMLPAERLVALGAPLNTLRPSGKMRLSWDSLLLSQDAEGMAVNGAMQLEMMQIASALSPVKPLGTYRLQFDWQGKQAQLMLTTASGPLLLSGEGKIIGGRLQFSGQASAAEGQEERLAILLNLLGQRRQIGNKNIIALEFK